MAAHDARTIANKFVYLGNEAGRPLTPMQLIKLVYLAHGWMLALFGRPLVREQIEAWKYGPVIRPLYKALREYGDQQVRIAVPTMGDTPLDREENHVIGEVFKKYGAASGIALSNMTHAPGSPWDQTWHRVGQNSVIPNDLIAEYFCRLADDARATAAARA